MVLLSVSYVIANRLMDKISLRWHNLCLWKNIKAVFITNFWQFNAKMKIIFGCSFNGNSYLFLYEWKLKTEHLNMFVTNKNNCYTSLISCSRSNESEIDSVDGFPLITWRPYFSACWCIFCRPQCSWWIHLITKISHLCSCSSAELLIQASVLPLK